MLFIVIGTYIHPYIEREDKEREKEMHLVEVNETAIVGLEVMFGELA